MHSTPTPSSDPERERRAIVAIACLAAAMRVAIALVSVGSNDVVTWWDFGRQVASGPFHEIWLTDDVMNHPPLPVLYAGAMYDLAGRSHYVFSLLIKLPGILAEVAAVFLIAHVVRGRTRSGRAARVAAILFAVNPVSLYVAGYHGNLDPLVGVLSLLAWWLADRGRLGAAALALGASINVKLVPAPTVFLLLACVRSRDDLTRVLAGLGAAFVPFAWMLGYLGPEFATRTLGYRPDLESWIAQLSWRARGHPTFGPLATWLAITFRATLSQLILAIVAVLAFYRLRRPTRLDAMTAAAIFWCCLTAIVFRPWQYAVWPVALLAALRPRWAIAYGIVGGVWLAWGYALAGTGQIPLKSIMLWNTPDPNIYASIFATLVLLLAAGSLARSRLPADAAPSIAAPPIRAG